MTAPASATAPSRIGSVDVVRGAAIVLMALDHVRDFVTELRFPPENLARGSAPLFFTRWVTHFCAPTFFLLAGVGIGIAMQRGRTAAQLSRYLVTRGFWLLFLELVVTQVGWRFSFTLLPALALVLWALGWSMIAMAALVHLPRWLVGAIGVLLIAAHNLFDDLRPEAFGSLAILWRFLHVPGFAIPGTLIVAYPLIPWVGVMMLGFMLAGVFQWEPVRRRRVLVWSGVTAFALFVLLRAMNGYGNPRPWTPQRTPGLTVASFFNVTKYPPSLMFLLMTLGPAMIALALTERWRGRLAQWLSVYGRVPMFFYCVHIFVAHASGVLLALAQGGTLMRIDVILNPASLPPWFGVGLPGVYAFWAAVVLLLYFPCRAFARMKETRDSWLLRYL